MNSRTIFITGGNRGIGFQIVKLLSLDLNNKVIVSVSNPSTSTDLTELAQSNKNIHIITLETSSQDSINKLSDQLQNVASDGIDTFISNEGIARPDAFKPILKATDWNVWTDHYYANAVGPVLITQIVYPFLLKRNTRQIVFISTAVRSLTQFLGLSSSVYGQSKAALNFIIINLADELKEEGFTVVALHPGSLRAELAEAAGSVLIEKNEQLEREIASISITPEMSGKAIVGVVEDLNKSDNGKFLSYDGTEISF